MTVVETAVGLAMVNAVSGEKKSGNAANSAGR